MKKMIMAGNTHFDPVWLWQWDEALSSITATFRAALARMEEYEDFTYSFSAPAVLEWIEQTDEALFEQIKKRIAEGRWELCEGWWLQADCNSAHGESYIRQGLYAQQYYQQKFGKTSKTVFNIDSFGHPQSLVQLLSGCGIENYVFWRPNEEHKPLPSPVFLWKGDNDTKVKAYRIGGAGGEIFTADITKDTLEPLLEEAKKFSHDYLVVYGVTDHGGAPTIEMIEKIKEVSCKEQGKTDILFGTVESYFEGVEEHQIPVVADELQVKFIGPSVNFTEIKKNNRLAEYAAMNAEKAAVLAENLLGKAYPKERIFNIWKDILFNQFHDILGGCCIEDAYFDARNLHGRALQDAKEIMQFSLQSMTNKIRMPGKNPDNAWNLVLWNLNGFDVESEFEAEVQWAWEFPWYNGAISLEDADGNEIPCQLIAEKPVLPKFRSRFVFRAKLPALGYRSFIVRQKEAAGERKRRYQLVFDENGGCSVYDTKKEKTVLTELLRPYVQKDICDTWGFNKTVYEQEKEFLTLAGCSMTEDGTIRTTYRLVWEYGKSSVEQLISIYETHIDCAYRVLWNEEGCALKFRLTNGEEATCTAAVPYGQITRAASEYEKPMGEWIRMAQNGEKICVAADSVFAYQFDGKAIGLSILRNCLFGDLRTEDLDESRHNRYMGQGVTTGKLRVFFEGNECREATLFNNPPVVLCEANHDGILPPEDSFFKNSSDTLLLTALKKSEADKGYVLRIQNPEQSAEKAELSFLGQTVSCSLNPGEIQTIVSDKNQSIKTNMLEE